MDRREFFHSWLGALVPTGSAAEKSTPVAVPNLGEHMKVLRLDPNAQYIIFADPCFVSDPALLLAPFRKAGIRAWAVPVPPATVGLLEASV